MTRNIVLAIVVFAFMSGCADLSPPPEKGVQTKSFKEIVELLPKVQKGTTRENVESILGMPHGTSNRSRGYTVFFYLERPGGFGTMKTIQIHFQNNVVQEVEEIEISIDPW